MSDTPETDAFIASQNHSPTTHQLKNFARILERERDEAREVASGLAVQEERVEEAQKELSSIHRWIERNHPDGFIDSLSYSQNLERVADHWYDRFDKVESERDEAIREMNRYKRQWEESRSENVECAK